MELGACILCRLASSTRSPYRTNAKPKTKGIGNEISQEKVRTQRGYRQEPAAALCPASLARLRLCSKGVKGEGRSRSTGDHTFTDVNCASFISTS